MLKKIHILFIASTIFIPGCLKIKQYHQKALTPLNPCIHFKTSEQSITLRAKQFNVVDCYRVFGERGKKLITQKHKTSIYPIQLSFTNKNNNTYILNKNNIDLKLMKYRHVAHRMQHSTILRSMGLLFSGVALASLTAIGGAAAVLIGTATTFAPIVIAGAATCVSAPFMLVIGTPVSTTVNGVRSLRTNTYIKKDVKQKSLAYQVAIKPEESVDTIIFVKGKDYKEAFNITLYNKNDKQDKIVLNIEINNTI